jgi:hypothetical protein
MYRDGEGRLHARNPAPGCPCALPPERTYTIDRMADGETWYAWEGTPSAGDVIATGPLDKVLRAVEQREAA